MSNIDLHTFNRWWDLAKVERSYLKKFHRKLFFRLLNYLPDRQVLLIYGLRRVGKTTLMYQLINHLLKNQTDPTKILYFSFDQKVESISALLKQYAVEVLNQDLLDAGRVYIFLDEIQKLTDWQNQLKLAYDLYPNVKFVISGSAGLLLTTGVHESLAGRVYKFLLSPLSFSEYLQVKNVSFTEPDASIFDHVNKLRISYFQQERILPLLMPYLKTGGFIELAKEKDELKIAEYAKVTLERVLYGDVATTFNLREPEVLWSIMQFASSKPGFLLDYKTLANTFGLNHKTLASYINYLRYSLLVKMLYNYSGSLLASERKAKKLYLSSTNFIYQAEKDRFNEPSFLAQVVENLVVVAFETKFFWRYRQYEVDLVINHKDQAVPIEIKWQTQITKSDLKGVLAFSRRFNTTQAVIITKDILKTEDVGRVQINFVPAWLTLLTI